MAQEHVSEAQTIEIDALIQLGEMLKETKRSEGGRPVESEITCTKKEQVINNTPTLPELGISRKTSSLAQKLATLPKAEVTAIKTSVKTVNRLVDAPAKIRSHCRHF
jgi:hypothetical protein